MLTDAVLRGCMQVDKERRRRERRALSQLSDAHRSILHDARESISRDNQMARWDKAPHKYNKYNKYISLFLYVFFLEFGCIACSLVVYGALCIEPACLLCCRCHLAQHYATEAKAKANSQGDGDGKSKKKTKKKTTTGRRNWARPLFTPPPLSLSLSHSKTAVVWLCYAH